MTMADRVPPARSFRCVPLHLFRGALLVCVCGTATLAAAQSVGLPVPRLLTMMPMGGQVGAEVEVTLSGQHLESASELVFSDSRISATAKLGAEGAAELNKFVVRIAADCPPGLYEASVMTRLGLSSPRVFSVGLQPEVTQLEPSTTVAAARPLELNTICNAVMPERAVNHYSFSANKGQRVIVDCAAAGIDSKSNAVLVVADAAGNDLVVQRRGGAIDFTAPEQGSYVIKVHELTFKGGPEYFYRLAITPVDGHSSVERSPSTRAVHAFSWPPTGLHATAPLAEIEPNDRSGQAQAITLPCDLTGSFAPAADVDLFEFTAKQGDVWWVEVASERLGRPTDPAIIVQHVGLADGNEVLTDVAELNDIPSPVKVSSNHYSYDGPPYNPGSSDILGKIEIKQDGLHRVRLSDLFGGTRDDPENVYRLVIRKPEPDFALVAWAMHMELRNGDRNALSKPITLRGGSTMALEVVALRRDGFDGEIELSMENLPDGVTARGLKLPPGQSRGIMLVTAAEGAPRGFSKATFVGRATIGGQAVTRPCRLASLAWPVPDHWSEIPSPRLLAEVCVSVGGAETAPITITAREDKVWEACEGEQLTIPLLHLKRSEFSGATMSARTLGSGFEQLAFDLPLDADHSEAVIDLAALKTPPGDYLIAFYGAAVAKYQPQPQAADAAKPSDIVDIIVSEPIAIRVKPAEKK
jgi:hypothetical protein